MTLQEFNSKYVYTSDKDQWGINDLWEVMQLKDGAYSGDCESYCLTLKAKVEGFEKLELWYCRTGDVGHCVGKLGDKFIDCNTRQLTEELTMRIGWEEFRPFTKNEIENALWSAIIYKVLDKLSRKAAISITDFLK